jgi:hypothetical protein
MKKEKFHIEYVFDKVSRKSLWNHITTPPGLSSWFSDDVIIDKDKYIFKWNNEEQTAEIVSIKPEVSVRYRWIDGDESHFFEFKIHIIELTGTIALEITDFAEPDEKEDTIELWDSQIEELKRTLGI